jgi:ADP-heptose:LPS heptosyltransferase
MLDPALHSRIRNRAGLSLAATAALLAKARLVVSVNTGVMHLAAAVGVPLIALHGPTSARRWGPVGPRAIALESPCDGCGYLDLGFEYSRQPRHCMNAISYRMVHEACAQVLDFAKS